MNETLMEVVEEFAAFLQLNQVDELKPDVADWGLMRLREILKGLDDQDRAALVSFFEGRVELCTGSYATFLQELPDSLELRGERDGPSAEERHG